MKTLFLLIIFLMLAGCTAEDIPSRKAEANFRQGTSNVYKRMEGFSTPDVISSPVKFTRSSWRFENRAGDIQNAVEEINEVESAEVIVVNDSAVISITLKQGEYDNQNLNWIRNKVKLKTKATDRDLSFITVAM